MKGSVAGPWISKWRSLFSRNGVKAGMKSRLLSSTSSYDVTFLGGGAMGSSSAYFLAKRQPGTRICVIERDPTVKLSSFNILN